MAIFQNNRNVLIGCVVLFIGAHLYLGKTTIDTFSATYDEPVHLTAGTLYWKTGNYRYNGLHHPAFSEMWPAIPLLWKSPDIPYMHPAWRKQQWGALDQYRFADLLIYKNRISHESLIASGRWMQLILSCVLGLCLLFFGIHFGGIKAGIISMGLWAFSPTLLGHGTLITTDFSFALFFFVFFASLSLWNTWRGPIVSGLSLGFMLASKYLAIAAFPVLFGIAVWNWRTLNKLKPTAGPLVASLVISFFILLFVYRFSEIHVFIKGFMQIVMRSQSGRSSYFLGAHSTTGHWAYFPVAFLIKTSLPLLIGLGLTLFCVFKKKLRFPSVLVIPPLLFFLLTCSSTVQIGHRHILAIYPFLILMVGLGLASLEKHWKYIPVILVLGMATEAWAVKPHFLSFFNQFVGGSKNGYHYMTDSNVDWGQGLKILSHELEPSDLEKGIYLSYFGVVDPHVYGIKYIDVGSDTIAGHQDNRGENLKPDKFAISVTQAQATYYVNKNIFDWLKEKEPINLVGNCILIYDFKNDPMALDRLKKMSGLKNG